MFNQQQDWANEPCYYVTAIDRITRIALLAGPYQTRIWPSASSAEPARGPSRRAAT